MFASITRLFASAPLFSLLRWLWVFVRSLFVVDQRIIRVAAVGPSGSGKSTLSSILSGGDGRVAPKTREVGYIPNRALSTENLYIENIDTRGSDFALASSQERAISFETWQKAIDTATSVVFMVSAEPLGENQRAYDHAAIDDLDTVLRYMTYHKDPYVRDMRVAIIINKCDIADDGAKNHMMEVFRGYTSQDTIKTFLLSANSPQMIWENSRRQLIQFLQPDDREFESAAIATG